MNVQDLKDDMLEIKVLHEKVEHMRSEGKDDEAETLQRRVHKKVRYLVYYTQLKLSCHSIN
jgi:hemolysin activation/secretion protein